MREAMLDGMLDEYSSLTAFIVGSKLISCFATVREGFYEGGCFYVV